MFTSDSAKISTQRLSQLTLLVLSTGMFMAILDVNVINIAVVEIQAEFHTQISLITWVVDAYNLSLAGLMLSGGVLADRYGGRIIWLLGVILFTLASLGCGLSHSVYLMIMMRLIQGAGAALFIPASFGLMPVIWPDPAVRQKVIGTFGGIVAVAAAAGPVTGGFLVTYLSWRSVFLINIPVGLCGVLIARKLLPLSDRQRQRGFDIAGQCCGIAILAGISFLLIELPELGWRSKPTSVISGAVLFFIFCFILIERYAKYPVVPLSLFLRPAFNIANCTGLLINACYFGVIYSLSLVLQNVLGFSAWQTGLALLPLAVFLMAGNLMAGKLMTRYGEKRQMVVGLLIAASGYMGLIFLGHQITLLIVVFMALLAGGTAFVVPPMTATVLRSVPSSMSAMASSIHTALRQIGSLIGIALAGLALSSIHSPLAIMMCACASVHLLLAMVIWRWFDISKL